MRGRDNPRLFVAHKPPFISSNRFLTHLKRKYGVKKAGFSGILDPFAKGSLIIGFGSYTRLFQYLPKTPKVYRATLWLGISSETLDIESVTKIDSTTQLSEKEIKSAIEKLKGEQSYTPPKYSAKRINGVRAYELARAKKDVVLKSIVSTIYEATFINYSHPFITFEVSVSEGAYIRSLAQIIVDSLGTKGALSSLTRLSEGEFFYEREKALNPFDILSVEQNSYKYDLSDIALGKKLSIDAFEKQEDGIYKILLLDSFSIIQVKDSIITYLLNNIQLAKQGD